jgi:hypothetical protein
MPRWTVESRPLGRSVRISESELEVVLADGRRISAPISWFPRLAAAAPEVRSHWELLGDGEGIHWPEADEDLSIAGLLAGVRVPAA